VPRAGLSADVIVAEAGRLVDDAGHDRLTLAALAKRFGVALPSLYKHVTGLEEVHARLATATATDLGSALRRAATGRAGADALRALARAYRQFTHDHPGRYHYLLRARPDDAAYSAAAEETLAVLYDVFAGYDIEGNDAVDAARYVRSTLHGFVSLELAQGFAMPRSVERSFGRLVDALDHALASWT
jgi:AcrR family transcriptional regulator